MTKPIKRYDDTDFNTWMAQSLAKIPNFESEYMEAILEEYQGNKNPRPIINALKQIALAQGINKVAERADMPRVTISRALSAKGNPRMDTFLSIVDALGLHISFSKNTQSCA